MRSCHLPRRSMRWVAELLIYVYTIIIGHHWKRFLALSACDGDLNELLEVYRLLVQLWRSQNRYAGVVAACLSWVLILLPDCWREVKSQVLLTFHCRLLVISIKFVTDPYVASIHWKRSPWSWTRRYWSLSRICPKICKCWLKTARITTDWSHHI